LTGTEVMLLVASETGHVYTFATRKLQPMITSENGKALIQTCLNSPDSPASELDTNASPPSVAAAGAAASGSSSESSDFSPVKIATGNHLVSIPKQLPLSCHGEKLQAQQVMYIHLYLPATVKMTELYSTVLHADRSHKGTNLSGEKFMLNF